MRANDQLSPFGGRLRILEANGNELEASEASFSVDPEALAIEPRAGAPLRVELADLDLIERGDYVLTLRLASGERIEASMLGRRFGELDEVLSGALRQYQAKHLLIEEPVGGEAFEGDFEQAGKSGEAEVRVYATSLAIIARAGVPFGVPFGEVRAIRFDESRYAIDLETVEGTLSLLRLGKRTQPCLRLIEQRLAELRQRTAEALAFLVPGVGTMPARRLASLLPDGVPGRRADLDAISAEIWPRLVKAAVGPGELAAAIETLSGLCPADEVAFGLKETGARQDQGSELDEQPDESKTAGEEGAEGQEGAEAASVTEGSEEAGEGEESPMSGRVAWFLFPVFHEDRSKPGNAIAVEAATRSGRATYLFRIAPPEQYASADLAQLRELARQRIRSVSRAMVALCFKREPIYLSDEKLRSGPYARYRLAMRLSEPLRTARESFVGRAIHGPSWRKQLEAALARARA